MTFATLLRVELFKAWKRSAIVILAISLVAIALITILPDHIVAVRNGDPSPIVFPRIWPIMVTSPSGPLTLILSAIVIIVTVASEFVWKTARQNVIDGLSKNQWFLAKLIISLTVCLAFTALMFLTGAIVAALNPFTDFIRKQDLRMFAGYVPAMFGYASAAMFFSLWVRKDGGALGLLLVLQGFIEPLLAFTLDRMHKGWMSILNYFPLHVMASNLSPRYWDPSIPVAEVSVFQTAGRFPIPTYGQNLALTLGYTALFLTAAYWNYRKRDL